MDQKALGVISDIYDTCLSPDKWQTALDGFVDVIGARGAVLIAQDLNFNPYKLQHNNSFYTTADVEYYFENFGRFEADGWRSLAKVPARCIVTDEQVWPDLDALRARPDAVWLREQHGVYRRFGVRLNESRGWTDSVGVQYGLELEDFPRGSFERAATLLPHMAKAVEIGRSFVVLRHHYQAVLDALDHVRIGMCVASAEGHVEISNQEADRILEARDGLWLDDDNRFACPDDERTAFLAQSVRQVAQTACGLNGSDAFLLEIPRASQTHPLIVEIFPLRDTSGEISTDYHGALVTIIDPDSPQRFDMDRMAKAVGLSPAETEISQWVVDGFSLPEIAEFRDVSTETVRSQLKSIYDKTGTSRRAELIRFALSLTPPIDTNGTSPG